MGVTGFLDLWVGGEPALRTTLGKGLVTFPIDPSVNRKRESGNGLHNEVTALSLWSICWLGKLTNVRHILPLGGASGSGRQALGLDQKREYYPVLHSSTKPEEIARPAVCRR